MGNRFKRMIAFLIDWNITLFPFLLVFMFIAGFLQRQSSVDPIIAIFCFLLVISAFVMFVLRDVIFKGRSLGKRIFGLCVYDKNTLQASSAKQCFLRNIFFFLYFIDGIILLATGDSIGDKVAGTVVLSQESLDSYKLAHTYSSDLADISPVPKKKNPQNAMKVVVIIICCLVAFIGLIHILLNAQKIRKNINWPMTICSQATLLMR